MAGLVIPLAVCLQLASAPPFRDLTREHVFFFADGKPVSFHEMEKRDGYTSLRALTKTNATREKPGPHPGFFANISRIIADDGVRHNLGADKKTAHAEFYRLMGDDNRPVLRASLQNQDFA